MEGKWKNGLTSQDQHRAKRVIYLVGLYACTLLLNLGNGKRRYRIERLGWKPILFLNRRLPGCQLLLLINNLRGDVGVHDGIETHSWRIHEDILSLDLTRSSLGQSFSSEDPQQSGFSSYSSVPLLFSPALIFMGQESGIPA